MEVAVVMPPHHPLWRLRRGERGAGQVDVAPLLHEHVPVPMDLRLQPYGKGKRAFCPRHAGLVIAFILGFDSHQKSFEKKISDCDSLYIKCILYTCIN